MGKGAVSSTIIRKLRGGIVTLVCLLGLLLGASRTQAQVAKGEILSVGFTNDKQQGGLYRTGTWIPVQVQLENLSGDELKNYHLAIDENLVDLDGDHIVSVGAAFNLPAKGKLDHAWVYYWPRPDIGVQNGITKVVLLDDRGVIVPGVSFSFAGQAPTPTAIGRADANVPQRSSRFVLVLGRNDAGWKKFEGMLGGAEDVACTQILDPKKLPDRAMGYDGVDVIYWQADNVKLAELTPAETELYPILDWVNAGGHLIISVSSPDQAQGFGSAEPRLRDVLPLTGMGSRRDAIKTSDLFGQGTWAAAFAPPANPPKADELPVTPLAQSIGTLRPGARIVIPETPSSGPAFADHPIAITSLCGRGAITLLTIDPSSDQFVQRVRMAPDQWIYFWNTVAGWRQNNFGLNVYSADQYAAKDRVAQEQAVSSTPRVFALGTDIQKSVDVSDVTAVRVLVALLFLAVYWLLAGPVSHLILRSNKVIHWSWWVFGGVVILATAVAGGVVLVLHVKNYEVRHRSFVLGTVTPQGAPDAETSVVSYYGIYAPVSGQIPIRQQPTTGINYLTPLCLPEGNLKSYADPQTYKLSLDHLDDSNPNYHGDQANLVYPVFRNTLKKLQGRWNGPLPGIRGSAQFAQNVQDIHHLLTGTLTNQTGYDLQSPQLIVNLPPFAPFMAKDAENRGSSYLFEMAGPWKNGQTIDLEKSLTFDELERDPDPRKNHLQFGTVEMALEAMSWKIQEGSRNSFAMGSGIPNNDDSQLQALYFRTWSHSSDPTPDLLYLLGDARNNDSLKEESRRELDRGMGRLVDRTKALRAAGAMIVAYADNAKSPVALSVNSNQVAGQGYITFAYILPLGGTPPIADLRQPFVAPAPAAPGSVPPPRNTPLLPDTIQPENK